MVGTYKINLDRWITATWLKQQTDVEYVSSHHIDEILVNDNKGQWLNDSLNLFDILQRKIKDISGDDMILLLVFTLNRSRQRGLFVKGIDDFCFSKTYTPPEFYLVSKSYNDFFSNSKIESQKVIIDSILFQRKEVYYTEKWDHGFNRWVLIY